jgi:hypothetical protein
VNATQRWIVLLIVYSLFLLIGLAALGAVLGFFPGVDETFKKLAVGTLIADIGAVGVTVFKTVFAVAENRVFVNLVFQGKTPTEVELVSCRYEVRDGNNVLKKQGEATVSRGPGGWHCSFPIVPGEVVHGYARLELNEQDNTVWQVPNFPLNTVTMQAERSASHVTR